MSYFDQLTDNISKLVKDAGNKAQEFTETQKINSRISDAKKLIKSTYAAIGETYYNKHKDDEEPEMAEQFKIIEEALKTIDEYRAKINSIKGVRICPSCGAEVAESSLFCHKCGVKFEPKAEETETAEENENESAAAGEPAEEKKCSVCGEPLGAEDTFCSNCGSPVVNNED